MSLLGKPIFQYTVFGVVGLCVIWLIGRQFLGERQLPPDELADLAMNAPTVEERQAAANELSKCGEEQIEAFRRIFLESDTPEVRAVMAQSLGKCRDIDSLGELIDAMEDPSPLVRGRAGAVVQEMVGMDMSFDAEGPPAERQKIVAFCRRFWKDAQAPGSKFIEYYKNPDQADASAAKKITESEEPTS
jgi:HEAT repeat protein